MTTKKTTKKTCHCGSGKKSIECCKIVKVVEVGPQTLEQAIWREMTKYMFANITEPHCHICGDTTQLMKLHTQNGEQVLCEFCYIVQMNM